MSNPSIEYLKLSFEGATAIAAIIALVGAWATIRDARKNASAAIAEAQRSYIENINSRVEQTLLQLDNQFNAILPALTDLEDPTAYRMYAPALKLAYENKSLTAENLKFIKLVDSCVHFYFLLYAREHLIPKHDRLREFYMYYWENMTSDTKPELKHYILTFYSGMRVWVERPSAA